jgi:hypothetical protein
MLAENRMVDRGKNILADFVKIFNVWIDNLNWFWKILLVISVD